MFKNIGALELIIVGLIILLLFGGKKLPELTRGLVNSIKEFRDAYKEGGKEANKKDKDIR
jgi:sec-independent protein translocase protein TatA